MAASERMQLFGAFVIFLSLFGHLKGDDDDVAFKDWLNNVVSQVQNPQSPGSALSLPADTTRNEIDAEQPTHDQFGELSNLQDPSLVGSDERRPSGDQVGYGQPTEPGTIPNWQGLSQQYEPGAGASLYGGGGPIASQEQQPGDHRSGQYAPQQGYFEQQPYPKYQPEAPVYQQAAAHQQYPADQQPVAQQSQAYPNQQPGYAEYVGYGDRQGPSYLQPQQQQQPQPMYPSGVANPQDDMNGSDTGLGQRFTTQESMNTTGQSDVDVTTEPSIQTDQQLLESLMGRPEGQEQQSAPSQEQGKAPGLSQLLIHGAPQAELNQAQYAYQMPATAGLDRQTDVGPSELPSPASGQQPPYPSQSSSAQETPQTSQRLGEQPVGSLQPELSAESRFESGFQDLGSLEAAVASTDRAEDSSKQGDTLLNRYLYPEKSASQEQAQADASRSDYIQLSKAQQTLSLPAEQQAESHKPQIRVNLSEVLDQQLGQEPTGVSSAVAASTEGDEMNFRYPELPQQQATVLRTDQGSSQNKQITEVATQMTTELSQTSDKQPTNGVDDDSLQHWVDEFDNDQEQNDRDDYEEDEDGVNGDDGYRLSDDEYNDSYRDRDGDADDEYDEDNYDEDGDEEMDEEDNYINKGAGPNGEEHDPGTLMQNITSYLTSNGSNVNTSLLVVNTSSTDNLTLNTSQLLSQTSEAGQLGSQLTNELSPVSGQSHLGVSHDGLPINNNQFDLQVQVGDQRIQHLASTNVADQAPDTSLLSFETSAHGLVPNDGQYLDSIGDKQSQITNGTDDELLVNVTTSIGVSNGSDQLAMFGTHSHNLTWQGNTINVTDELVGEDRAWFEHTADIGDSNTAPGADNDTTRPHISEPSSKYSSIPDRNVTSTNTTLSTPVASLNYTGSGHEQVNLTQHDVMGAGLENVSSTYNILTKPDDKQPANEALAGEDQSQNIQQKVSEETTTPLMDFASTTDSKLPSSTRSGNVQKGSEFYDEDEDDDDDDDETSLSKVMSGKGSFVGGAMAIPAKDVEQPSSGHFMAYFVTFMVLVILGYLLYHNRKKVGHKVMAYVLEGRNGKQRRGRGGNGYQKLSTNVEEALPAVEGAETKQSFVY